MKLRELAPPAALGLAALLVIAARLTAESRTPPRPLRPEEALAKARVDGKYAMLLCQIKEEQEFKEFGAFRDRGQLPASPQYHGHKDVPAGYWVYVYPYWYIWRDRVDQPQQAKRAWGPEQATGEPDTPTAGDMQTAWAALQASGQDEWLMLEYAEPVVPSAVLVHETYHPGALVRVTAFNLAGEEIELWKGKDPTAPDTDKGVSEIKCDADFKTCRVKLYIDSKAVPGWNEIDAVGLRDAGGKTHWATSAAASSTYAEQNGAVAPFVFIGPAPAPLPVLPPPPAAPLNPAPNPPPAVNPAPGPGPNPPPAANPPAPPPNGPGASTRERINELEKEVQDLKDRIKALEDRLNKEK
jgi:hypothetical protein